MGGTDDNRFSISGDKLLTAEVFDYDASVAANNSLSILIRTDDGENGTFDKAFTITIIEEGSNSAPTISNQTFEINENASNGTSVGTVTANDAEQDNITYALVSGNESGAFAIDGSTGEITVADGSQLDFETVEQFSLQVSAADAFLSNTATMTVNVTNLNEPTNFTSVTEPSDYPFGASSLEVSADITDEDGLTEVRLYHKKFGDADYSSFIVNASGDTYSASISSSDLGTIGTAYYLSATDAFGEVTRTVVRAVAEVTTSQAVDVRQVASITPGAEVSNYTILAFPFANAQVNTVFSGLMPYDDEKWRLMTWSDSEYSDKSSGRLSPGVGYFFITTDNTATINASGALAQTNSDDVFTIDLQSGYNLIGNPFPGTLNWPAVLQHNVNEGIISNTSEVGSLVTYSSGGFNFGQSSIGNLEGAFVQASGAVSNFEIPISALSGNRISRTVSSPEVVDIDQLEWEFDLFLSSDDLSYRVAGLGLNQRAKNGVDQLDLQPLPRFSTYLDLRFEDEIARSMKEVNDFQSWEFSIPTNVKDKYIDLTWDIPSSASKTLLLVDAASELIYDMSITEGVKILNAPSAKHQIYFGDKDEIYSNLDLPFDAMINLYPNPVREFMNLEMYAQEQKSSTISIVSIDGKTVFTTVQALNKGLNKWKIDLNGDSFVNGVYLLKVDNHILTKFIKK